MMIDSQHARGHGLVLGAYRGLSVLARIILTRIFPDRTKVENTGKHSQSGLMYAAKMCGPQLDYFKKAIPTGRHYSDGSEVKPATPKKQPLPAEQNNLGFS